jgi:acetyl esterase/lipase
VRNRRVLSGMATILAVLAIAAIDSTAQERTMIPIWPEGVPGAIPNGGPERILDGGRIENIHNPTLTLYLAPNGVSTGTAVIVCPGGSYARLAFEHEGRAVAEWLNSIGVSAFLLKYRLREYGHPAPLRDVLRSVRLLRDGAAKWRIEPQRIGVIGFSAGGHLAATAGTLFDAPEGRTGAPIDTISARPDFIIAIYPVITFRPPYAHEGSKTSLLGPNLSAGMIDRLSADLQVSANSSPTFLVHGGEDKSVPPENSVLFFLALRKAGVPVEMHMYQSGGHGFGLAAGQPLVSDWPRRAADWMAARGLLKAPTTASKQ